MKALLLAVFPLLVVVLAGCDLNKLTSLEGAPPAGSNQPSSGNSQANSSASPSANPARTATAKPTPKPADWMWDKYKNPLDKSREDNVKQTRR